MPQIAAAPDHPEGNTPVGQQHRRRLAALRRPAAPPPARPVEQVHAELDAHYATVPNVRCKGLCHRIGCQSVGMTPVEQERIATTTGVQIPLAVAGRCPALSSSGNCTVYQVRPAVCRLYGTVENLRCPYGCEPEQLLTAGEGAQFMREVDRITGLAGPADPPPARRPGGSRRGDGPLEAVEPLVEFLQQLHPPRVR